MPPLKTVPDRPTKFKDDVQHHNKRMERGYKMSLRRDTVRTLHMTTTISSSTTDPLAQALADAAADISVLRKREAELWDVKIVPWKREAMIAINTELVLFSEATIQVTVTGSQMFLKVATVTDIIYFFQFRPDWHICSNAEIPVWPDRHTTLQSPPVTWGKLTDNAFLAEDYAMEAINTASPLRKWSPTHVWPCFRQHLTSSHPAAI